MTGKQKVYFGADPEAVRKYIDDAVAKAINEAAQTIRDIRDYVDEMDASVARCRARHDDRACSICVERAAIVEDIRRVLPSVPAVREVTECAEKTETLSDLSS